MKIEILPGSVVWRKSRVEISITKEQAEELKAALAVVQRYEKLANQAYRQEFKHSPKDSDWCEYSYAVKNDRVFVSIRDGMAG